jgi:hypothetical protein
MRRLPKYLQGFIDRHGKTRFYFRRAGFKTVALPGLPWSPPFMAAYEAALAGQPAEIGISRVKPGTMWALAVSYFNSPEFRSLESSSRYNYRAAIERFCKQSDNGQQNGEKRVATLQHRHVVALMAVREPRVANTLRKALRAMMKHAVVVGLRCDDPTRDVKAIAIKSSGHHTWTEAEIMQSKRAIRLVRARLSPWRSCCIRDSGARTSFAWDASTSGAKLSMSDNRKLGLSCLFRLAPSCVRLSMALPPGI